MTPPPPQDPITTLLDIEAIKQLKAEYCDICDSAHDPDRIVEIFSEDCVWEGEGVATARGHAPERASGRPG